ncbi:MAG: hypothetical protein KDC00_01385 [Flavobacteriales bacterium]|nr:hypothetical protein [Flavobacteriales bacterium]
MTNETPGSKLLLGFGLALTGAVLGLFAGGLFGRLMVSKADGMAGAVEVLAYALLGGVALLIGAIVLVRQSPRQVSVRILLIGAPIALALLTYATWHFMKNKAEKDMQWQEEQERYKQLKPTAPAMNVMFVSSSTMVSRSENTGEEPPPRLGLGMASPLMGLGTFHFYNEPDLDQLPGMFRATDSLTFEKGEHFTNITSAPPWFAPAHLKLDYDLVLMKVITLSRAWMEVEVNNIDGTTRWVDRGEVDFVTWPVFIYTVNTVEIIDPEMNPIRIKPLDHASVLAEGTSALLVPIAVQGDWLMVSTNGLADRIAPTGWIRWRDGERLLVRYNLLC